jgi:rSAM/selenodomain-associated transferase 2
MNDAPFQTPSSELSIAVIIPTWCEVADIEAAVRSAGAIGDEVVVADAGSPDGTAAAARRAGAKVVQAARGRGPQLDAGARASQADVLLFLHADARLPQEAREAIQVALACDAVAGGNFMLRFEPEGYAARLFGRANHLRRRWLKIYYGDSALFMRRSVYAALGGFRPLPIFEDYELIRRFERAHDTAYIEHVEVRASARRFERAPLRSLGLWAGLQLLFSAGVSPHVLSRWYADVRLDPPPSA